MDARQYQTFNIAELETIVTQGWNSSDALRSIAQELNFRNTKRAIRLQRKVEHRISELNQEATSSGANQPEKTEDEVLYAQAGLHPSAPDFLIEAARKAYRKYFHPDRYASDEKSEAEEAFKNMDNIFDLIEESRQ